MGLIKLNRIRGEAEKKGRRSQVQGETRVGSTWHTMQPRMQDPAGMNTKLVKSNEE